MSTHASYDGYLLKIAQKIRDGDPLPQGARLITWQARLVRPNGRYYGAPTCTLHHLQGVGYIASDIRPDTTTHQGT